MLSVQMTTFEFIKMSSRRLSFDVEYNRTILYGRNIPTADDIQDKSLQMICPIAYSKQLYTPNRLILSPI